MSEAEIGRTTSENRDKKVLDTFKWLIHRPEWRVLPSAEETEAFESGLRSSGYWNVITGIYEIDYSATYTPPFHPSYITAEQENSRRRDNGGGAWTHHTHVDAATTNKPMSGDDELVLVADNEEDDHITASSILKAEIHPRLSPFTKVLRHADHVSLRKFLTYATVQMRKVGLISLSDARDVRKTLNNVLARPSVQLSFLLCMQHYFM